MREKLISFLSEHGLDVAQFSAYAVIIGIGIYLSCGHSSTSRTITGSYRVEVYDGGVRTGVWSTEAILVAPDGTFAFTSSDDPEQPAIILRANTTIITELP